LPRKKDHEKTTERNKTPTLIQSSHYGYVTSKKKNILIFVILLKNLFSFNDFKQKLLAIRGLIYTDLLLITASL